ncbi:MAG: sigma-70 family RNA polymerase sigma factor [bacterium]|nr:sigma-70 family RNA polymerase sigma factor [bacterium]
MDESLEELFARYRERDDLDALARVFDRVAPRLLALARHLTSDRAAAEDLVQATFLVAIERRRRFDPSQRLTGWLTGILTRTARNRSRKRSPELVEVTAEGGSDPLRDAASREFAAERERALQRVPAAYRPVVTMHVERHQAPGEIARELGRSPSTVRVQLHRGLAHLRRALPAGFALGAAALVQPRGLAAVRAAVVERGARPAPRTILLLEGVLMKKLLVFAAGLLALVGIGSFWFWGPEHPVEPETTASPGTRAAALEETPTEAASIEEVESASERAALVASESPAQAASLAPALRVRVLWDGVDAAGDVMVEVTPQGFAQPEQHKRFAATGSDGSVLFEDLPPGAALVRADREMYGMGHTVELSAGAVAELSISIGDERTVSGTVFSTAGKPVAGATVWLGWQDQGFAVATTSTDGTFLVFALPKFGSLHASAPDHGLSDRLDIAGLPERDSTRIADFHLLGEPAGLEGRVVDADGVPTPHVLVRIEPQFFKTGGHFVPFAPVTVISDGDGRFSAPALHEGVAEIVFCGPGTALGVAAIFLDPGETETIELVLPRAASVTGTVRDQLGEPIEGARVSQGLQATETAVIGRNWRRSIGLSGQHLARIEIRTAADGSYRLEGVAPGPVQIIVSERVDGSEGRTSIELELAPGEERVWDAVLGGRPSITGHVLDEAGAPLEGWLVSARSEQRPIEFPLRATTDSAGAFEVVDCGDASYVLEVFRSELVDAPSLRLVPVEPGAAPLRLEVPANRRPNASIRGRVVQAAGVALPAGYLFLDCAGSGFHASTPVDREGHFKFQKLVPGTYRLEARDGMNGPRVVLDPIELGPRAAHDVGEVTLADYGSLEVEVVLPPGTELEESQIRVHVSGRGDSRHTTTHEDLRYRAEGLVPGRYHVEVHAKGHLSAVRQVGVLGAQVAAETVALAAGANRYVRLLSPPGARVSKDARLRLWNAAGELLVNARARGSEREGRVIFYVGRIGLAPGEYRFEASTTVGRYAEPAHEATGELSVPAVPGEEPLDIDLVRAD